MRYSNPAGRDAGAATAYVAALLELLGDRDPIRVLRSTAGALRDLVAGVPRARLTREEAPGKWSVAGVLQHLADSEGVNGHRIRLMLVEETPPIAAYDQDAWARAFDYGRADPVAALGDFTALRAANLRLWESLDEASLGRGGVHAERGVESVGRLLQLLAAHDLVHLRQVGRILGVADRA